MGLSMLSLVRRGRRLGAPWWCRAAAWLIAALIGALCFVVMWPPQFAAAAPDTPQRNPNRWPVVSAEKQAAGSAVRGEAFTTDAQARAMVPARPGRWEVTPGEADIRLQAGRGEAARSEAHAQRAGDLPVTIVPGRSSEPETNPDAEKSPEAARRSESDRVRVRVLPWEQTVAAGAGMLVEVSAPGWVGCAL